MAQDREVLGAVAFAQAGCIFPERDVEHPMQRVFDVPVAALMAQQPGGAELATGDVVAPLDRDVRAAAARSIRRAVSSETKRAWARRVTVASCAPRVPAPPGGIYVRESHVRMLITQQRSLISAKWLQKSW